MSTKTTITMRTNETGADGEALRAGQTYELEAASANHWLKRGKAEAGKVAVEKAQPETDSAPETNPADARRAEGDEKAAAAKAAEALPPVDMRGTVAEPPAVASKPSPKK